MLLNTKGNTVLMILVFFAVSLIGSYILIDNVRQTKRFAVSVSQQTAFSGIESKIKLILGDEVLCENFLGGNLADLNQNVSLRWPAFAAFQLNGTQMTDGLTVQSFKIVERTPHPTLPLTYNLTLHLKMEETSAFFVKDSADFKIIASLDVANKIATCFGEKSLKNTCLNSGGNYDRNGIPKCKLGKAAFSCPGGKFIQGFNPDGTPICV